MKAFLQKLPLYFASTVLVLALLSLFGWGVKKITQGKSVLPSSVNDGVNAFVSWPDLMQKMEKQMSEVPKTFVPTPDGFEGVNKLEEPLKILTSYHNAEDGRTIALIDLKSGRELKTWTVKKVGNIHDRICHPVMLADSSIIYGLEWNSGLIRIDKDSKVVWRQPAFFNHHGKNLAADSTLWTCSYYKQPGTNMPHRGTFKVGDKKYSILDNSITQLDVETGEILFKKSMLDMMVENGMAHLLIKSDVAKDPIHLNDVQPALKDGPYFNKGDLFLSARNGSWVVQYRPSLDSVIRVIEGPFYAQHDVDVESDSTLLVFNNNTHRREIFRKGIGELSKEELTEVPPFKSEVVRYYLGSDRFERVEQDLMVENDVYSMTEGLVERLPDGGVFVEEQNSSILWVFESGQVKYKGVLPSHYEGYHHLANWARPMNN